MDHDILRNLAGRLADIAALDCQQETARLYRAVNDCHMIRPVVLLDELPWNQLNINDELTLQCQDPYLRSVELGLRRTLYRWNHCRGDLFVDHCYCLPRVFWFDSIGISIQEDTLAADPTNHIVSHHYYDQLATWDDLQKLHSPELHIDDAMTARRREQLDGIFGDLLPIRVTGASSIGYYQPWDNIAMWRGVEPIFIDLIERPDFIHAIMRKLVDIQKDKIRKLEEADLLDTYLPVLHCTPGLTDDLPKDLVNGRVTRHNLWARGMAQCFANVSPAMHDEFEIQYMKEVFDDFGLLYYGCCEPLHDKLDILRKFPNLRKISITPWADVHVAAEKMGSCLVMSRKPNPAFVAGNTIDKDAIRREILETLQLCRQHNISCEFILKDISTVCYHPENLTQWSDLVLDLVKNF